MTVVSIDHLPAFKEYMSDWGDKSGNAFEKGVRLAEAMRLDGSSLGKLDELRLYETIGFEGMYLYSWQIGMVNKPDIGLLHEAQKYIGFAITLAEQLGEEKRLDYSKMVQTRIGEYLKGVYHS